MKRRVMSHFLALVSLGAQTVYQCPMDPDIRASAPGACSKCGMALVADLPDLIRYPVRLTTDPPDITPGQPVEVALEILDPETRKRQKDFHLVHERPLHLLFVSDDLEVFGHEHPALGRDGVFRLRQAFPQEGGYRLLADFYPHGAAPQTELLTLMTKDFARSLAGGAPHLRADREPKRGPNLEIGLRTEPPEPLATFKTLVFLELGTAEGLEKYLGAWAHLFIASADLLNLTHAHPTIADGGPVIQVNVIFPAPGMYRLWVQIQRHGVVNTVPFTIEVGKLG